MNGLLLTRTYVISVTDIDVLTLTEASNLTSYSQEYLSLLARKGTLGAFELRRNWVITKKALNEYLERSTLKSSFHLHNNLEKRIDEA
jgi:excisionase family DNA binding protein